MTEFIFNNVQYNIFPNWIIRIHIFSVSIWILDLISACACVLLVEWPKYKNSTQPNVSFRIILYTQLTIQSISMS